MTEIERKALAQAVQAAGRRLQDYNIMAEENVLRQSIEAHARTIKEFDAFRMEVSDALEYFMDGPVGLGTARERLGRFILPKPVDPLVEALLQAFPVSFDECPMQPCDVDNFRAALAARGLEIREVR